jgi:hypothetical protein
LVHENYSTSQKKNDLIKLVTSAPKTARNVSNEEKRDNDNNLFRDAS